jgi:hypothetical protein
MAVDAYWQDPKNLKIRKLARQCAVWYKTVRDPISHGRVSKEEASERMQRLCSIEEASLEIWM